MAKVGYIFLAEAYESVESDKAWMEKFGCVKIVEENAEDEKLRPEWKALLMSLERGDELVLANSVMHCVVPENCHTSSNYAVSR